jgi:hypothetical protein
VGRTNFGENFPKLVDSSDINAGPSVRIGGVARLRHVRITHSDPGGPVCPDQIGSDEAGATGYQHSGTRRQAAGEVSLRRGHRHRTVRVLMSRMPPE